MRVALALGSGGARGYAHIGVIHELLERGHDIVGVAGSSMGALVGGLHAAGKRHRRGGRILDGRAGRRPARGGQARRIHAVGKLFDAAHGAPPARPVAE
ncbi:patatin-like phospholipase family protein, partial [Mycolicibacterium sphagni]|nr:patatin-like phospholipase family protein [Mycolicibacterium sphagni]